MLTACGDDDGKPARVISPTSVVREACEPEVQDHLDPASGTHLLPGAPAPSYATDPPTSGSHAPGRYPTGRLEQPLDRPVQVALLEEGAVLLQHRGLNGDDQARLESLAGGDVTVAPNPDLPAGVVATAWTFHQQCSAVDVDALQAFIERHAGKAAG
jgi:uncharacterized protein DUF3105